MELSVLDLGSTTFHLQHVNVDGQGQFSTTLDSKRMLCLGAQVFSDGFIDKGSRIACLAAVEELLTQARARHPDVQAIVATSAIRSASNGDALVREIERCFDVSVRVLEPREEARLAYLGQSTWRGIGGRRVAVVDLGGGSVEIAVGEGTRCMLTDSLPIGAVRVRATHTRDFDAAEVTALSLQLRQELEASLRAVRALAPEVVVFGSGSARAVRRLLLRDSAQPGKTGPIAAHTLRALLYAHLGFSPAQLIATGAVEAQRASTVLVSATIMCELMDQLGVHEAVVSDKGLRDGVALELYRQNVARSRDIGSVQARGAEISRSA